MKLANGVIFFCNKKKTLLYGLLVHFILCSMNFSDDIRNIFSYIKGMHVLASLKPTVLLFLEFLLDFSQKNKY